MGATAERWSFSRIAADIATLGSGTLAAGLFNAGLVFVIPKLISVEDYGYWRIFGLYAGYVGFLHFGFADGALLRWAGRAWQDFQDEVGPAVRYLIWQHLLVVLPVCGIAIVVLHGPLRFVVLAVAVYAPLFNITATLQFALEGARIFWPVALSVIAAPAALLASVFVWAGVFRSTAEEVIGLYLLAWCVPLIFLFAWTQQRRKQSRSAHGLAKACLASGWPIMLANTGVNLIQTADGLAASWAATIQNFAQYSLAASAMAVPMTAIQACSKVLFSHLAGVTADSRKHVYGIGSRTLLMVWAILLPYYFALVIVVQNFLPKYVASLEYARILLLGVPFLATILILQMNYAYLNGMQRKFLARTVLVLAASMGMTSFAAFHAKSLTVVAAVQVAILGAWWLFNEHGLKSLTGQRAGDWVKFMGVYTCTGISYWVVSGNAPNMATAVGSYYVMLVVILGLGCRDDWRSIFSEMSGGARESEAGEA